MVELFGYVWRIFLQSGLILVDWSDWGLDRRREGNTNLLLPRKLTYLVKGIIGSVSQIVVNRWGGYSDKSGGGGVWGHHLSRIKHFE